MHTNPQTTIESTTDSILVVLDAAHPERTIRAAMQDHDPAETTFHLVSVMPTSSYEARRRSFADAGVPGTYTIGQAEEEARQTAERVGREFLSPESAGLEATGAVGREWNQVRTLVETHDVTTVYAPDRSPSILQRLLGGGSRARTIARALPADVAVEAVDVVAGPSERAAGHHRAFEAGGSTGQSN